MKKDLSFLTSRFKLYALWPSRPQTLGEFATTAHRYIERLRPLHPLFSGTLYMTGTRAGDLQTLAQDCSNLTDHLQKLGWDRGAPANWYTGVTARPKAMSLDGTSTLGFRLSFTSSGNTLKENGFAASVYAGTSEPTSVDHLSMSFPTKEHTEFEDPLFVKGLILASVEVFEPATACVTSTDFLKRLLLTTLSAEPLAG